MSKYDPLGKYLENSEKNCIKLSFAEIEKIINEKLPNSLYEYPAAWYGTAKGSPTHRWKVVWNNYGYRVDKVDLNEKNVTFIKIN